MQTYRVEYQDNKYNTKGWEIVKHTDRDHAEWEVGNMLIKRIGSNEFEITKVTAV